MATTSFQNGSEGSILHNMRDPEQMKKEERNMGEDFHIDLSKESEIWHHEDLKDAYKESFQNL